MKLQNLVGFSKDNKVPKNPLRNLEELANELGVNRKTLQGKLAKIKGAPKAIFKHNNGKARTSWYDHQEVRKWWDSLNHN